MIDIEVNSWVPWAIAPITAPRSATRSGVAGDAVSDLEVRRANHKVRARRWPSGRYDGWTRRSRSADWPSGGKSCKPFPTPE